MEDPVKEDNRARRRKRRRKRRLVVVAWFFAVVLALAWVFESQATTTVILVRFVQDETSMTQTHSLDAGGQERAQELKRILSEVDVETSVDAIFASQFVYSQQTAQPMSELLDIPVQVWDAYDTEGLSAHILEEYKGKIVLVVTHTKSVPVIVSELHGINDLPSPVGAEYDNIYIVSIPWFGKVKTLRLQYGLPYSGG
jgi:broad specificity phosphatase PhoE